MDTYWVTGCSAGAAVVESAGVSANSPLRFFFLLRLRLSPTSVSMTIEVFSRGNLSLSVSNGHLGHEGGENKAFIYLRPIR